MIGIVPLSGYTPGHLMAVQMYHYMLQLEMTENVRTYLSPAGVPVVIIHNDPIIAAR